MDHHHNHETTFTGEEWGADIYPGKKSFFFRRVGGRTGTFGAHFFAALMIGGTGTVLLVLALLRSRRLAVGESFARAYIPERNPVVLNRLGVAFLVVLSLILVESYFVTHSLADMIAHGSMYVSAMPVGICAILERRGRIPYDTHRRFWAFSLVVQYFTWKSHASMKSVVVDGSVHEVLAYVILVNALVMTYSILNPESVLSYLGGWALMTLQGIWLLFIGYFECCIPLKFGVVVPYLTYFTTGLFVTIVGVYVVWGPKPTTLSEYVPINNSEKQDGRTAVSGGLDHEASHSSFKD